MNPLKKITLFSTLVLFPAIVHADCSEDSYDYHIRPNTSQHSPFSWSYPNENIRIYRWGRQEFDPIQQGIRNGELSRAEVRELRQERWNIANKEYAYRRDGQLTEKERKSLRNSWKDYYHDLNHELHDGEHRW